MTSSLGVQPHLADIFFRMGQGVVVQTLEGAIIDANPAAERILGLSLDQLQATTAVNPLWSYVDEDGLEVATADLPAMIALQTGKPVFGAILGIRHPDRADTTWIEVDAHCRFQPGMNTPEAVYTVFTDITSLRQSEERLAMAMSATGEGIWDYNLATGLVSHNERWCEMLDLPPKFMEHPYNFLNRLVHEEDRKLVQRRLETSIKTGRNYHSVHRLRRPKQREIWVEDRGIVVKRDADGSALRMVGSITDITERYEAEESLRRERDLFSGGPVLTTLRSTMKGWPILHVSPNVGEILGYTEEEIREENFFFTDYIHPEDLAQFQEKMASHIDRQIDSCEHDYRLRTKDKGYRLFHDVSRFERDNQGRVVTVRGYMFDITDSRAAELELQDERRRLGDIIEGTNAGTWEWSIPSGEVIFNDRWAAIVGYTLDELQPLSIDTWTSLCHPDDLKLSGKLLEAHFQGETDLYECEARMRHKDGHWVWVLDRGKVCEWDQSGQPLLMSGTHMEISDQKAAAAELERVNKDLAQQTMISREMADKAQLASQAKKPISRKYEPRNSYPNEWGHWYAATLDGIFAPRGTR